MDIVIAYCEDWDTPLRTSKHHFAKRLAEQGNRVLYIEVPITPFSVLRRFGDFFQNKLPKIRRGLRQVEVNIWVLTGFFPFPYHKGFFGIFDRLLFNKLNQLFFLKYIKQTLRKLNFNNPNLIVYYPFIYPIIDKLFFDKVLFHIVDEWQELPRIPSSMLRLTKKMLSGADIVVVSSNRLYEKYKCYNDNLHLLRHGTDIDLFKPVVECKVEPMKNLLELNSPKIGYYGALHKLDFALIAEVVKKKPRWSFIFIGPLSGAQGFQLKHKLPSNVYFRDSISRDELPSFLASIDVVWMPYQINELTHNMCSIKIYEVLSAGLPMVISKLDESQQIAQDFALFAESAVEHLQQLEHAFEKETPEQRLKRFEFVSTCDWEERFKEFLSFLKQ